jgi:hypothetical protein
MTDDPLSASQEPPTTVIARLDELIAQALYRDDGEGLPPSSRLYRCRVCSTGWIDGGTFSSAPRHDPVCPVPALVTSLRALIREEPPTPPAYPPLLHELGAPSPWQPIQDKPLQAALGKLAEELAEAGAAVARCLIQGLDECEPVTKVPNRVWLENELADVQAAAAIVMTHYELDQKRMLVRQIRKMEHLTEWRRMLTEVI